MVQDEQERLFRRRMNGAFVWAFCGLVLGLVGGCSRVDGPNEQAEIEKLLARGEQAVEVRVDDTEEWKRILRSIRAAHEYYKVERTWGNPASIGEDRLMERKLARAVRDVHALVNRELLAPPEAALVVMDIERETWHRYHRSRNIRYGTNGVETHIDGILYPPEWDARVSLEGRLPPLRELARLRGRDRVIIDRVLQTAHRNVIQLSKNDSPSGRELVREATALMRATRSHACASPPAPPDPPSANR